MLLGLQMTLDKFVWNSIGRAISLNIKEIKVRDPMDIQDRVIACAAWPTRRRPATHHLIMKMEAKRGTG